jgi:ATP-dependent Clp protease ATP-binding subunit ClpA
MFERFTERARQVVVLAQDETRALRHDHIGTEHLLLGLLREESGCAARALGSLGITVQDVRGEVARTAGQGDEITTGQIPFSPRAKKVLELALREALAIGHNYIGTEHILLGLVRENDGVAARILLDFDADPETVRQAVIGILTGPALSSAPAPSGSSLSIEGVTRRPRSGRRATSATTGPPRLTRAARRALILAQEEARAFKHVRMGTEHILLGLLREEHGLAARLLDALEITLDDVRTQVLRLAGPGNEEAATGHILFTPQAKNALERARNEALSLEHGSIGTEHLLLGLMRQDDGIAARILRESRR